MEKAMPAAERLTHNNLRLWMQRHAMAKSVLQNADVLEDDDNDAELAQILESLGDDATVGDEEDNDEEGEGGAPSSRNAACEQEDEDEKEEAGEDESAGGAVGEGKNWSAVN